MVSTFEFLYGGWPSGYPRCRTCCGEKWHRSRVTKCYNNRRKSKILFRYFFVDWGFKFPVRCAFRRAEIDEVPDFENFTMAEKRDVMSARKEKSYSKIDNLTSTDFNEHFAESGKFSLLFSDKSITRVITRI